MRFGASYPITPATTIMEILRAELPKYGGLFVQTEDELAAVSMALGFSYSGYLAVTGSSGQRVCTGRSQRRSSQRSSQRSEDQEDDRAGRGGGPPGSTPPVISVYPVPTRLVLRGPGLDRCCRAR